MDLNVFSASPVATDYSEGRQSSLPAAVTPTDATRSFVQHASVTSTNAPKRRTPEKTESVRPHGRIDRPMAFRFVAASPSQRD